MGFWKEDPRSEVAVLSHHIRAADICTTSRGLSAWSPGSGGVCQGGLLLVLFSGLFGSHSWRQPTLLRVGAKLREDPLCGLEFHEEDGLVGVCALWRGPSSVLFVWLLTCSSLNHQDIINPQILLLRTPSLSHTASHSSFSSSRSVPATALQGALVHFIGEWDLETRNQTVVCGHCCWGVFACRPLSR